VVPRLLDIALHRSTFCYSPCHFCYPTTGWNSTALFFWCYWLPGTWWLTAPTRSLTAASSCRLVPDCQTASVNMGEGGEVVPTTLLRDKHISYILSLQDVCW